jgi:hypothetical protein
MGNMSRPLPQLGKPWKNLKNKQRNGIEEELFNAGFVGFEYPGASGIF